MKILLFISIPILLLSACSSTPPAPQKMWNVVIAEDEDSTLSCAEIGNKINYVEVTKNDVYSEQSNEDLRISNLRMSTLTITEPMLKPFAQLTLQKAEQNYAQRMAYLESVKEKLKAKRDHLSRLNSYQCGRDA